MEITEVKEYSPEILSAINALLPQLSSSENQLDTQEFENILTI